jgi:hypothetical protein
MSAALSADLVGLLRDHRLLAPGHQAEVERDLVGRFPTAPALLPELVRRGWLTEYQRDQLLGGHAAALRLGPYVITDYLGAGGMGEVFQARQEKLGRVVALKVIRRERLEKPDAVKRFHREIRAAARLDHPNIVRAYDADEIAGTHLLVMEYVPGTDLAHRVKDGGPLPVPVAADYVRQAALGLQHAAERGLVHRDFKPANLLVTPAGVVKILDMGLARLRAEGPDPEPSSPVTREGVVVGSPDFIAPEQAMDPKRIDVRADLYSLGCTFYFLLTGQPPFPGGETVQKLMRHQLEEPVPVEDLRPDVTPRVAAVVRRLMAKRPEDRFQSPADAAAALDENGPDPASFPTGVGGVVPVLGVRWDEVTGPDGSGTHVEPVSRKPRPWKLIAAGAGIVAVVAATGLLIRAARPTPAAPVIRNAPPPPPKAEPALSPTFEDWKKKTRALTGPAQVTAVIEEFRRRHNGQHIQVFADYDATKTVVVGVRLNIDRVTDLTPLQGFGGLKSLHCEGTTPSLLSDLRGLAGLGLTFLRCEDARVTDLSPLKGMPLETLWMSANPGLSDLSPLAGMELKDLRVGVTAVADLEPVRGMPLWYLACYSTRIESLAPLSGMKSLVVLDCGSNPRIRDVTPVKTLTSLRELSLAGAPALTDLTLLADLPLKYLNVSETPVSDLTPIQGNRTLEEINCRRTAIKDLRPLAKLPLKRIRCDYKPEYAAALRAIPTLEAINDRPPAETLGK